jgi:catechol 2,3-dioxygenase-like lactoylglutathione lyase family enzyme
MSVAPRGDPRAMITDLFAGVPVSHLDASIDWYTRFFGRPPDMRAGEEILWEIDEHADNLSREHIELARGRGRRHPHALPAVATRGAERLGPRSRGSPDGYPARLREGELALPALGGGRNRDAELDSPTASAPTRIFQSFSRMTRATSRWPRTRYGGRRRMGQRVAAPASTRPRRRRRSTSSRRCSSCSRERRPDRSP